MDTNDSQWSAWSEGGHTVPGGIDELGRRTPRLTSFDPAYEPTKPSILDQLEPMTQPSLKPAPATIKLSELVEQALEQWKSWHDYSSDFGDQPSIHVERTESTVGYVHHHIYMDWRASKSKYTCRVRLDLTGEPGEVYSLQFDQKPAGEKLFVGPLYSFERTLFHLYTGKTKIIVDRADFEDVYWPEVDD